MNEKPIYTVEYDETIPTRERDGVFEHIHKVYENWHSEEMRNRVYEEWHPVSTQHMGCGRVDDGEESGVRMCGDCDYVSIPSMCHGRKRELGLSMGWVAHYVSGMTRTNEGVAEHIHDGYKIWHSVNILHFGCRRVEDGVVKDSIMCSTCAGFDSNDECHRIYDMRKMTEVDYFSHKNLGHCDNHE